MKKYLSLLKYESKTIIRDSMNLYMCLFPIVMLILSSVVFPVIFESMDHTNEAAIRITMLILLVVIVAMGSYFLAAMATFLLIEHKDECTLNTIAVTPLGTSGYIRFKMSYVYIMSAISTVIVFLGTKIIAGDKYVIAGMSLFDNIGVGHIVAFALADGLFAPALALFQGALAKNKVEGFAYIKGTGVLALIPVILILDTFQGGLQYVLGIFPNFWAVKGIMLKLFPVENSANLSYPMYLMIGAAYNIIVLIVAYRFFQKKAEY